MTREIILPADEQAWLALRCHDLTSTDIPALFGMSPYKTLFELWHEKRSGERMAFVESERMKRGKYFEPVIAALLAEREGWNIRPMKEYIRLPELRIAASFDFQIIDEQPAVLEIKRVNFREMANNWIVEDDWIEAPAHIEIQHQVQLMVSGLQRGVIGADIDGRDETRVLHRTPNLPTHDAIRAAAAAFWQSIDANEPPPPVMPDDAAAVIRMHAYAEPGKFLDARDNAALAGMAAEYNRLGKEARDLENLREVLKADMLRAIGDHEKAALAGWKISAGIVGPCDVAYTRKPYRDFRITQVKPAKSAA